MPQCHNPDRKPKVSCSQRLRNDAQCMHLECQSVAEVRGGECSIGFLCCVLNSAGSAVWAINYIIVVICGPSLYIYIYLFIYIYIYICTYVRLRSAATLKFKGACCMHFDRNFTNRLSKNVQQCKECDKNLKVWQTSAYCVCVCDSCHVHHEMYWDIVSTVRIITWHVEFHEVYSSEHKLWVSEPIRFSGKVKRKPIEPLGLFVCLRTKQRNNICNVIASLLQSFRPTVHIDSLIVRMCQPLRDSNSSTMI